MTLRMNVKGKERQAMVAEISKILDLPVSYTGVPLCKYIVGIYEVARDGTVTGPDNADLVERLAEQGFASAEVESSASERLSLEYPLDGFTPEKLDNLRKLMESKAVLIKKALGVDDLPIQILIDRIAFPWFPADSDGDAVDAYAQFITCLCDTAKEKKRVIAKAPESFENPAFAMRVWLIGLGMVGPEYRLARHLFVSPQGGCSAWRYGPPAKPVEDAAVTAADVPADDAAGGTAIGTPDGTAEE